MTPLDESLQPDATRCFVMAEVAQTHDGSLGLAHAFIDAVADTGVDAIKFQTHIAAEESTPGEPFRVEFSKQDTSRYDYWKRMEFSEEQWSELAKHAASKKLQFLSSPFSIKAVELLERVGVPGWKVGSGEVTNHTMLQRMMDTGKPVLLSTGMSTWQEMEDATTLLKKGNAPFALFQATTAYPTPPERVGLNLIQEIKKRFDCPVGLSDHSGTIFAGLGAYTLGARLLEVHVTLSRDMFGPDVSSSVTVEELKQLVEGVRFLEQVVSHPLDKNSMAQELEPLRKIFQKSVAPTRNLPAGTVLGPDELTLKKPGTGIPSEKLSSLFGKRLKRDVREDELLQPQDIET